ERGGQVGVDSAAHRDRARDVLAGVAVAVEAYLGRRAQPPAKLLVLHELARHRGIGNREVIAVAASHAQCPIGARERSIGTGPDAAEQTVEKATRPAAGRLAVLPAAIILSQGHQDAAAPPFALAAVALEPAEVGQRAVAAGGQTV